MLNHNKRLIKSKSKILLLALCIFGLLFSYSCNCRNNSTAPVDDTPQKTPDPTVLIPSISLSRELMVVDSGGTKTTKGITLTVANADIETFSITDDGSLGLTKDDFSLTEGVLSLNNNFGKLTDNTEKTLTLTVNYKKKTDAEANTTLSKTTDTKTFKIVKAEKLNATTLKPEVEKAASALNASGNKESLFNFSKEDGGIYIFSNTDTDDVFEYDAVELITKMRGRLSKSTAGYFTDAIYNEDVRDAGNNSISFTFTLALTDKYEMDDNNKITIKVENVKQDAKWVLPTV